MKKEKIFEQTHMEVINIGLVGFQESIKQQNVPCVHVDWRPPAGGNKRLLDIIDQLKARG